MDIHEFLEELDALFAAQKLEEVEPFLVSRLELGFECKDFGACISILNEMIGFFRDTSQYHKALERCEQVLALMKELEYEGTLPYATTCLNVANALRAAGHHQESLTFYEGIFPIYEALLPAEDERIAALYNNLSLLYQEMQDFEKAVECLKKALAIVERGEDIIKVAITHSNLGASLLQLGRVEEAEGHLRRALSIFDSFVEKDFHYSAAMTAMGQIYVAQNRLEEAARCYRIALREQEKHCGRSQAYYRILEHLNFVEDCLGKELTQGTQKPQIRGLDLSEAFYRQVAAEGLYEAFPGLVDRMAVGLVGEGSECYGFDDEFSADHDFGPGFCIWLNRKDYEEYGEQLRRFYEALPEYFMGYRCRPAEAGGRVDVWCTEDFFRRYTGYASATEMLASGVNLLTISEEGMSTVLNGRIFCDPSGFFIAERRAFYEAFDERYWRSRIALSLIALGKYGQYNYPRCMKRGDYVTAQMVLYKYVEELLKLVHYINHSFPPYYKWLKKSASGLDKLAVLASLTEALADFADGRQAWSEDGTGSTDRILGTVEIIAGLILEECRANGILDGINLPQEELFLEAYGKELYRSMLTEQTTEKSYANHTTAELVDTIVLKEWRAFDKVQNIGGRADCQNDWGTFSIMRKSQYLTWPKELLISFLQDFDAAEQAGWNLITEKYARMMESTDYENFKQIEASLPPLTAEQRAIIEQIVALQVSWMEEFAAEYPHMASNARTIHTAEDSLYNTSYETYLRGELSTYSPQTLKEYGQFVVQLARDGQNLAKRIMNNTALLYGYESLEDAEAGLAE